MRHENYEVLGANKYLDKRLEKLCAENRSVTFNNKELSWRCKCSKMIETAKDQLQSRIDSPSTKIETTWCQKNEENVVLEGELKRVMAEMDREVETMKIPLKSTISAR